MPFPDTESPIEDIFESEFFKHAEPSLRLIRQQEFQTQLGTFRVDFVLPIGNHLIGFECDGKKYHSLADDEIRDAVLLGEAHLETIYHLPGKELWFQPAYAIEFIARQDCGIFLPRTLLAVQRQIETHAIRPSLYMRRWSRKPGSTPREFWRIIYRNIQDWKVTSIGDYRNRECGDWDSRFSASDKVVDGDLQ